ncbi:MAG: hypothetical protein HRU38_23460 [Saccharospirillaceae bacterium]|nr:hypothetical protein [Saccharospirillaceae bacterium]
MSKGIDNLFNGNWATFHDAILGATGEETTLEKAKELFKSLPIELQEVAIEHGLNDTVFCDSIMEHFEDTPLHFNAESQVIISEPNSGKSVLDEFNKFK